MDLTTIFLVVLLCCLAYVQGKKSVQSEDQRLRRRIMTLETMIASLEKDKKQLIREQEILIGAIRNVNRPSPPKEKTWREVFGYQHWRDVTREDIQNAYRRLAKERQASEAALKELNIARDQALKEIRA